jgi:phosphatidylglycerol:prolipoprotein diacylglycerol transferase
MQSIVPRRRRNLHPYLISIDSFHLPTYGALLAVAIMGGIYVAIQLGRRVGVTSGQILDFSGWVLLISLLGAKVLMILALWGYYCAHPGEIFSLATLRTSGAFYGGFLAALFFTVWYARVVKISFWNFTDVLSPSVALGTTVTRLGCFSAGCDYGKPTTAPWGVVFTNVFAHEANGVPLGVRLHPTQLYESATTLAIFGVLLWWFPRRKREGDIFLGYLGLYAVGRFLLEFLRGDEDRGFVFHHLLSTSQFVALLVLAGIVAVLTWRHLRGGAELSTVPGSSSAPPAAKAEPHGGPPPTPRPGAAKASKKAKRKIRMGKLRK